MGDPRPPAEIGIRGVLSSSVDRTNVRQLNCTVPPKIFLCLRAMPLSALALDVLLVIVAAGEGAKAGVAINRALLQEDGIC
jgi:hypothetical protein